MSVFDIILHELECPVTHKTSEREIFIKWNCPEFRKVKVGDIIGYNSEAGKFIGYHPHMSNLWVKKNYHCKDCELLMDEKYPGWKDKGTQGLTPITEVQREHPEISESEYYHLQGSPHPDEYYHFAFINFQNSKIIEIISEEEANKRDLTDYIEG